MLTQRMYDAMKKAWTNTQRAPLKLLAFRNTKLELEFNPKASLTEAALTAALKDESRPVERRILAAMGLSSRLRVAKGQLIDLPCLDLGDAQVVLFPGEAFVGYQLMAQKMRPKSFVMSIGYGECWTGYIPTESAFREGFGDSWLWVAPGSEERIKTALRRVLLDE